MPIQAGEGVKVRGNTADITLGVGVSASVRAGRNPVNIGRGKIFHDLWIVPLVLYGIHFKGDGKRSHVTQAGNILCMGLGRLKIGYIQFNQADNNRNHDQQFYKSETCRSLFHGFSHLSNDIITAKNL